MVALVTIIAVLAGIVIGKLFVLPILVTITVACIVICVYFAITKEEIEGLITVIFAYIALIVNIAMWATYYLTTNQNWLETFFDAYVFR